MAAAITSERFRVSKSVIVAIHPPKKMHPERTCSLREQKRSESVRGWVRPRYPSKIYIAGEADEKLGVIDLAIFCSTSKFLEFLTYRCRA